MTSFLTTIREDFVCGMIGRLTLSKINQNLC